MPHANAEAERLLRFLRHHGPDGFLVGPDGDIGALDVDDIFARPFNDLIADAVEFLAGSAFHDPSEERGLSRSILGPSLVFFENEAGLFLADRCRVIGGYVTCDLGLDPAYRGRGLGREIVLEQFLRHQSLPVWGLDTPAFSRAGLAAHRAAWRMGIEGDAIAKRLASRIPEVAEISIDLSALAPRPGGGYSPGMGG